MLNPAKDTPERKIRSVRAPDTSFRITPVASSASTLRTPILTVSSLSPLNQTATIEAERPRDEVVRLRVDGPSSSPTALSV